MTTAVQTLGAWVRAVRHDTGVSQSSLAADTNIDVTYLSKIEHGVMMPSVAWCVAAAEALHVPAEELLVRLFAERDTVPIPVAGLDEDDRWTLARLVLKTGSAPAPHRGEG